jgi:hypothetical protein
MIPGIEVGAQAGIEPATGACWTGTDRLGQSVTGDPTPLHHLVPSPLFRLRATLKARPSYLVTRHYRRG